MICAEQNKKISFLITYNPFSNRTVFSFIPVLACWYMAIHYHAMYQTSDDMDMRILLEGSIGGSISEPSEFTLYMMENSSNFFTQYIKMAIGMICLPISLPAPLSLYLLCQYARILSERVCSLRY